jgi:hypothetical protein
MKEMEKGTFKAVIPALALGVELWVVSELDLSTYRVMGWAFDENGAGYPLIMNEFRKELETVGSLLSEKEDEEPWVFFNSMEEVTKYIAASVAEHGLPPS